MADTTKFNSATGELRILSEARGWRQKVELWLLNGEVNRNNWRYDNLDAHKHLFADTPILVAYVGDKIGDAHNFEEIREKDGSIRASFMSATAERIVGYFKSDSDIRIESRDGKEWIVGTGYIWRWYAAELVAKLKEQGLSGMAVSIETLIDEGHFEGETEVFTRYQILGTTILGDDVAPAVADANIRALSAIGADEMRKMTLRVASAEAEANKNPQKKKKTGETKMTKISDVQAKLNGYKVLSVRNGHAIMQDEKRDLYVCSVTAESGDVVCGEKTAVEQFEVNANGENVVVNCSDVIGQMSAEIDKAKRDFDAEHEARVNAEARLEKMEKAEHERRVDCVKNAIKSRFEKINAMRGGNLNAEIVKPLETEEKIGEYAQMEDEDGKFCGDERAARDVDSLCMDQILAADMRPNAAKVYAWDIGAVGVKEHKDALTSAIDDICSE